MTFIASQVKIYLYRHQSCIQRVAMRQCSRRVVSANRMVRTDSNSGFRTSGSYKQKSTCKMYNYERNANVQK